MKKYFWLYEKLLIIKALAFPTEPVLCTRSRCVDVAMLGVFQKEQNSEAVSSTYKPVWSSRFWL